MKQSHKFAAGVIASLGLGIAVATAYAHPGQMGGEMGAQSKGEMEHGKGGMQHGQGGMQHGTKSMQHGKGGEQHGARHGQDSSRGHGAGLMTPEERTALREKMRNAKTPEERQQIATATRAEMQKRAQEKGITLPEGRGPRTGATTDHQH